jgi:hypothetical protein
MDHGDLSFIHSLIEIESEFRFVTLVGLERKSSKKTQVFFPASLGCRRGRGIPGPVGAKSPCAIRHPRRKVFNLCGQVGSLT